MKNILKNKKGFTLLEVLVTIGIVGVLSAIAIPAYNQYKQNANETAVKLEVSSAQKAYLAYDTVENTFCVNLAGAGVGTVGTSAVYTQADDNFAGFNSDSCTIALTGIKTGGSTLSPSLCVLDESTFRFGAGFDRSSQAVGYHIGDGDSGPRESTPGTASCGQTVSGTGTCTHTNKTACNSDNDCQWSASIADICG